MPGAAVMRKDEYQFLVLCVSTDETVQMGLLAARLVLVVQWQLN